MSLVHDVCILVKPYHRKGGSRSTCLVYQMETFTLIQMNHTRMAIASVCFNQTKPAKYEHTLKQMLTEVFMFTFKLNVF